MAGPRNFYGKYHKIGPKPIFVTMFYRLLYKTKMHKCPLQKNRNKAAGLYEFCFVIIFFCQGGKF